MGLQQLLQKITGSILSPGKDDEEKVGKHKWPQDLMRKDNSDSASTRPLQFRECH